MENNDSRVEVHSVEAEVETQLATDLKGLGVQQEDGEEVARENIGKEDEAVLETNVEDFESEGWKLDTVPVEIFLHICSFLDSGFLLQNVTLVCKHFYSILSNEKTWKIRQEKRWGSNGKYPPVPVDEDSFPWSRACWKREEQIKLWGREEENLRNVELRSHIACVDAVHLFEQGKFLATGSRDRNIIIWDVEKALEASGNNNAVAGSSSSGVKKDDSRVGSSSSESAEAAPTPPPTTSAAAAAATAPRIVSEAPQSSIVSVNPAAHKGWIWAFTSNHKHLLSASWDNSVRIWDKSSFKLVAELPTHRVACLSLAMTDNLVACGTFDKKILLFDPREDSYKPLSSYTVHKRSVLALGMDDNRIISCSEDGQTVLYDIRAQKGVKRIKLSNGAYPTCLSFRREAPAPLFYIGDRSGRIHLVNSDLFKIVQTFDVGHKQIVQGVFHSLGSVMTCSRDGHLKIMEPSSGLQELASLKINAELPGVDSFNNTVALAGGDSIVRLWAPIEGF